MKERQHALEEMEYYLTKGRPDIAKHFGERSQWLKNRIENYDYSQEDKRWERYFDIHRRAENKYKQMPPEEKMALEERLQKVTHSG